MLKSRSKCVPSFLQIAKTNSKHCTKNTSGTNRTNDTMNSIHINTTYICFYLTPNRL